MMSSAEENSFGPLFHIPPPSAWSLGGTEEEGAFPFSFIRSHTQGGIRNGFHHEQKRDLVKNRYLRPIVPGSRNKGLFPLLPLLLCNSQASSFFLAKNPRHKREEKGFSPSPSFFHSSRIPTNRDLCEALCRKSAQSYIRISSKKCDI